MRKLGSITAGLQISPSRFRNGFLCWYISKQHTERWSTCVSPPSTYYHSFYVFHKLSKSHILPPLNFQENCLLLCCTWSIYEGSLLVSFSSFSKNDFLLEGQKNLINNRENADPLHHTDWCYLLYLDSPLLFVSLHHLILLITTGTRFLFLLCILIQYERLKL